MEEQEPIRLLLATHTTGVVQPAYAQAMMAACYQMGGNGIPLAPVLFMDSDVSRGRNQAAAAMLENDFSHLLFVDADIEFSPEAPVRLLAAGKDVAVGLYPKKNDRNEYNFEFIPNREGAVRVCQETGFLEVMRAGTGFMLIHRRVFERMRDEMPHLAYVERRKEGGWRTLWKFFEFETRETPNGREDFSEDFNFCERWRALGGTIWADPECKLNHWGMKAYRGDPDAHILGGGEFVGGSNGSSGH